MSVEKELIRRCGQGDHDALLPLIRVFWDPVRGLLVRLPAPTEDVDDVRSEVFVRRWRSAPRYRGECAPSAWIYRIAVSAATGRAPPAAVAQSKRHRSRQHKKG